MAPVRVWAIPGACCITFVSTSSAYAFYLLYLQAAPRVLFMRAFAHLFDGKPSGLNTLNILRGNSHMIALQQSINQTVIDDFTAAREAVRVSDAVLNAQANHLVSLMQYAFASA